MSEQQAATPQQPPSADIDSHNSLPSGSETSIVRIAVTVIVIVLLAAGVWFVKDHFEAKAEAEARKALQDMGALVVMDANQQYAGVVNLTLPQIEPQLHEAVVHVPALCRLETLELSRSRLVDDDLVHVGKNSHLKSLQLSETAVTDAGVAHLSNLSNLEALHAVGTKITNAGLDSIGQLTTVEVLDLSDNDLSGDLAPLANLKRLKWLLLRNMTIDDTAFATIAKIPTLGRLTLNGCTLNRAALEALLKASPNLDVDVDGARDASGAGVGEEESADEETAEDVEAPADAGNSDDASADEKASDDGSEAADDTEDSV
jgi:hypothetical protein